MKCFKQSGFTLIEIVVTVVIVAIFSTMVLTFLSKSLVGGYDPVEKKFIGGSADPVKRLQRATDLNRVMANIMANYNRYPKWRNGTSYAAGNFIVPTIRNGHFYVCTTPGVSGATEPAIWPTPCPSCPSCSSCPSSPCCSSCASCPSCAAVNDGSVVQWNWGGCLPSLSTLQGSIGAENSDQNNSYGLYHVEKNRYIMFSSGSEVDDTTGLNKILKVTIINDQGGTLTALFISN